MAEGAEKVVLCWGNGGALPTEESGYGTRETSYGREMYAFLRTELQNFLYCFGVTKSGEPRHPLRLSAKTPLVPFGYAMQAAVPESLEEDF